MARSLLVRLSLVTLLSVPLSASALGSEMKYFSMNLHCALGNWRARVDQVLDEIARSNPDVAGFQEVCRGSGADMARYIVTGLEKRGYPVRFSRTYDTHWTFFKYQEQLLVVSRRDVTSYETGGLPSMPFFENGYIAVQIDGQWIVNTHLHFLFKFIRKMQYKVLAHRWGRRDAIVFGDLNSSSRSSESKPLSGKGWTPHFAGATYPSDKPKEVLDGFWTSSSLTSRVTGLDIRRVFVGAPKPPSDHLGIELKVRYQ